MPRPLHSHWLNLRQPSGSGGSGAPTNATYVVLSLDPTLTSERVLTAGANITIVDGGANGPVTISAASGAVGPQGPPGVEGPEGVEGPPGPPGPPGPTGTAGAAGPQGSPGPMGMPGADGEDGADGPVGPRGPQGAIGPLGPPGMDGLDGDDWPTMIPGIPGPIGATGAAGVAGPMGPPGADGEGGGGDDFALIGYPSGSLLSAPHNLLSATHGDTVPTIPNAVGYLITSGTAGKWTTINNDTTDRRKFLRTQSIAGDAQVPVWDILQASDIPTGFQTPIGIEGEFDTNEWSTAPQGFPIQPNFPQAWWESFPTFDPAISETRRIARFNAPVNMQPGGIISQALEILTIDPAVTAVGSSVISALTGINLSPTVSLGSNISFAGIKAFGTFTNTVAPTFGSWTLFQAGPTLVSATATIAPYTPIVYASQPTVQYNATGTATLGFARGYSESMILQNLSSGTFTVTDADEFYSAPSARQTSGTLNVTNLRGLRVTRVAVASTNPAITTHLGVDVDNLTLNAAGGSINTTNPIGFRTAITSTATSRAFQDTGGALSQYLGMSAHAYAPTSQTIPTAYYAMFAKRQQWTGSQRLTLQGTARVAGY